MSLHDGILNGIDSLASDAQVKVSLAHECLDQALQEAECITDDKAILATVKDGVVNAIKEAKEYLDEL